MMRSPSPALVAAVRSVLEQRHGAHITGQELLAAVRAHGVAAGNLRRVQEAVALLVQQGVPVASTSTEGRRGYALTKDAAEIRAAMRQLDNRARSTFARRAALRRALAEVEGPGPQLRFAIEGGT